MYSCSSAFFLSLLILLLWLSSTEASHFRFGSVAWFPTPGYSSNTVTFTFHLAFRRSFSNSYYCDETTKSHRALIGYGDSWRATCSLNPQCSTISLADTGFYCTDYSVTEDWSMGENNFTYTFPSYNSIWTLSYTSCCWISSLSRYANSRWLVSGEIDLSPRSDNGKINSSPVTRSLAIIRFQESCPKEIRIPVEDPDGDTVKCRWASVAESSVANDSFPHGTLNEITCVLKYEGGNGTAGTYAVTLTLEDFPAGTTNFNSVRPFSAVGLQFLVIITGQLGLCNDVPVFTDSTPKDGECSEIQIGSAYTAVIEVQLADFAKHVVEIATSSPPGMQITALSYHQGTYYRNVTWYPSQYQFGQNLFCFQAVDSSGLQSSLHCITILVGLSNTPQVILGSQRPMYPKSELGPGLLWWRVQFDRVIKKPRSSAYIRLVLLPSGYTVYKVDTLSQYAVIDSNRTVLHFATPKAALSMNGSYAILIDHGAIVGQGCSYDGPPSPGITSVSDWGFPVNGVCPVGFSLAPPRFTNCVDVDECASHSRSKRSSWWWWFNPSPSPTTAYGGPTVSESANSWYTSGQTVSSSSISPYSSVNAIHPTPTSEMPSSLYAASSVNVLPNPSQFELHLPSDCEQICSNTFGSHTCSCVSGYQLAPDGKSCLDTDECSINNGGCSHDCFNIPGSFYCGCPEGRTMGANNLTCVEPGVSVSCGDSNMTVSLEKRTFPFFEVSQLHLRYSSCRATENDTHLLISTTLNGCGTLVNETEDALIFWNEIQADAVIIDYVITRTHDIKLPFYCSYSRRKLLSLSFTPQPIYILTEVGYGNLTFRIDFYKSSLFDTPYSLQDYPLEVELNQYIYVRYSVESSADLAIMAVTCKATKDGSFYSWPQYTIIQNGCPRDTTMDYSFDTSRSYQEFKVKTFRFFNDYETVYLHCELLACHRYSPNSRCSQGCSINKRKKRDVTRDEIEHEESTSKVILTQGPLVFKKEEQNSGETEQNKQNGALIGGTAAAGGFGLIAFVALAVLFVKYRIARRFMNRNKVGDLYTTQDEQLSRRNAYIQEDDMIEKEDAF